MNDLLFDMASLREAYRSKNISPVDVASEALSRIEAYAAPAVWIARASEGDVLAGARALTAQGQSETQPLWGIPFAVKDNIDVAGFPTTAGCPAFAYRPERNAHCIERLIAAGAMFLGKTNLDQFATGLVGTRSPYGAPRCVFDSRYVSGGSSSGSAIAVAAGLVSFSLGTDTAGSGRVPAAYNNIVGLKPTRGLISTSGVVPACRSLDCVSVFANTVGDAAEIRWVAEGFDAIDIYSRRPSSRTLPQARFRFGVLAPEEREFFGDTDNASLYEDAITRLASLGGEVVEINYTPFRAAGDLLYQGPWTAERLAAIKDFMTHHEDEVDPTVRSIIAGARSLTAVNAFEGQYRLTVARRAADAEWARVDILLLPTAPTQDRVDEVNADPIARNARLGRYTNFVNLLDCCAIAVPAGFRSDGLSFGVTLVAPAFSDASLAVIADAFHHAAHCGMGALRNVPIAGGNRVLREEDKDRVSIFVVGAHLSGMALNHQLAELDGRFYATARTTPEYRLYLLPDTNPAKPGLVRTPHARGPGIPGEIWTLAPDALGRFVAGIPAPLGIGKVMLEDGTSVSGFLCEAHAVEDAVEITEFGGWRRYIESQS
ncbi:MAG TPA: allophanate hydrolase [Micropepsaceae bacterium]|nr:allophanate hydrolase [Micropepsaceae bacterium]